jgi:regulator of protease activity HflC (stomatin/prohibitin superfamily)
MDTSVLFTAALVALAFVLLFSVVKIVPQGREMTVERFGKYTRTLSPGISILTPFVERIGRRMCLSKRSSPRTTPWSRWTPSSSSR